MKITLTKEMYAYSMLRHSRSVEDNTSELDRLCQTYGIESVAKAYRKYIKE